MTTAITRQTQRLPEHWHFDQTGQPIPTFGDERQARLDERRARIQLEAELRQLRRQSSYPPTKRKTRPPRQKAGMNGFRSHKRPASCRVTPATCQTA